MPQAGGGGGGGHLPGQAPTHRAPRAAGSEQSPTSPPHPPVQSGSPQGLPWWVPISPCCSRNTPETPPSDGLRALARPSSPPPYLAQLTPRAIWLMVRTVRQGGSEPLGTQMGGGKGRGQGSRHVPFARLFPLPLLNKGNSSPTLEGGGQRVLEEAGRRGVVGMAKGRGWGWGPHAPPLPSLGSRLR